LTNSELFIEINGLCKSYKHIQAVDHLSLKVFRGDIYGFLGPNGAGKSTTIRMILSLITPDAGTIKLFGQELAFHRYSTLNQIGSIIEKPDFYKYLTARENLQILGKLSNVKHLKKKIDEVLELVGLLDRGDSKVSTYSQGMKQRLGIAQSILHDPKLIVLDEPANGLDPQGQKEMRELIHTINKDKGITILISSHILNEVEMTANRMVIINKGKNIVEGNVQDLLNESDMNVSFFVSDPEELKQKLTESSWIENLKETDNEKLVFQIKHEKIAELNRYIVNTGTDIFAIKPLRSLEDYFIKLTADDQVN
jgi:ABC-type multidrug transport system ATPase subunit